jgi:putative DNA-invertase from lambdoid prophage Rac
MAVYGYVRVSTVRQVDEGESLDVQQRQLEGYAHMHALKITKIEVEKGVSGSVPVDQRPVGGALLAKLEKGDIVIAAKLDRLFRSALDALNVVASLKQRGVFLHLLDLGGDIAGNGLSKLFLTIAAAFAEAERDRIRERIGQSKADQKARGRYLGGKIPFGWRRDGPDGDVMVEVPEEQEAIREMIRLRLEERQPLRVVVEAMAKRGHRISHQSVVNIVARVEA